MSAMILLLAMSFCFNGVLHAMNKLSLTSSSSIPHLSLYDSNSLIFLRYSLGVSPSENRVIFVSILLDFLVSGLDSSSWLVLIPSFLMCSALSCICSTTSDLDSKGQCLAASFESCRGIGASPLPEAGLWLHPQQLPGLPPLPSSWHHHLSWCW